MHAVYRDDKLVTTSTSSLNHKSKFDGIYVGAVIVKTHEKTNKCTILHYEVLQLKHYNSDMYRPLYIPGDELQRSKHVRVVVL
jgi:hypothetical protein